jgi:hypothetical protein
LPKREIKILKKKWFWRFSIAKSVTSPKKEEKEYKSPDSLLYYGFHSVAKN